MMTDLMPQTDVREIDLARLAVAYQGLPNDEFVLLSLCFGLSDSVGNRYSPTEAGRILKINKDAANDRFDSGLRLIRLAYGDARLTWDRVAEALMAARMAGHLEFNGVKKVIPDPSVVRELLSRNLRENRLLRAQLRVSERAAQMER